MIDKTAYSEHFIKHDINAFCGSDQIQDMNSRIGLAGYGVYWVIIEWLYRKDDHMLGKDNVHGLAYSMHISDQELLQFIAVLRNCGLLVKDEENGGYYSNRVNREVETMRAEKEKIAQIKRKAGIASGVSRGSKSVKSNTCSTAVQHVFNDSSTDVQSAGTDVELNRIEENRKEENRKEYLSKEDGLTDLSSSFQRLEETYGADNVEYIKRKVDERLAGSGQVVKNYEAYLESALQSALAKGQIRKPSKPMKTTTATQLYNDGHCPHCGKRLEANACRECGLVWTYKNGAWVEEELATGFGKKLDELKEASNA